jgi:hypothetical protein
MKMSSEIKELVAALVQAQAKMDFAKKDSENPFFHSSYADLAAVWDVCRQVLPKNGFAVIQTMVPCEPGYMQVDTLLSHISGQWIMGECKLPIVKNDPQAAGSAITYARRYSLAAIVGVIATDDDGNEASGKKMPLNITLPVQNAFPGSTPVIDPYVSKNKFLQLTEKIGTSTSIEELQEVKKRMVADKPFMVEIDIANLRVTYQQKEKELTFSR